MTLYGKRVSKYHPHILEDKYFDEIIPLMMADVYQEKGGVNTNYSTRTVRVFKFV